MLQYTVSPPQQQNSTALNMLQYTVSPPQQHNSTALNMLQYTVSPPQQHTTMMCTEKLNDFSCCAVSEEQQFVL
jgi:hypothetical protein